MVVVANLILVVSPLAVIQVKPAKIRKRTAMTPIIPRIILMASPKAVWGDLVPIVLIGLLKIKPLLLSWAKAARGKNRIIRSRKMVIFFIRIYLQQTLVSLPEQRYF